MSCCGNRRAALRLAPTVYAPTTAHSAHPANRPSECAVALRHRHAATVVVRGEVTGKLYRFARGESVVVAAADARGMVGRGEFVEVLRGAA